MKWSQHLCTSLILFSALSGTSVQAQVAEQDSLALVALYNSTDGPNWRDNTGWLMGPVPSWSGIRHSGDRVIIIRLNENTLAGEIPPGLGNLTNLLVLSLSANQLTGEIPPELGNLTNLQHLGLDRNTLTGEIPRWFGDLANLQILILAGNQLTAEIPSELGNLTNLRSLDLNENTLTGEIPRWFGDMTNLRQLGLNENTLTGEIPPELGNLTNLEVLLLGGNQLTGEIPPELGNLTDLRQLGLSFNQLTGEVPPELGSLISLEYLFLDHNGLLTGMLPLSLTSLSKINTFLFNDTDLCEPLEPAFQSWLLGITFVQSTGCTTGTSKEDLGSIQIDFTLSAIYPNPFNSWTTISYTLPKSSNVTLTVYDLMGREVRILDAGMKSAGRYEVIFDATGLSTGVYFYTLKAGTFSQAGKMVVSR